MRFNGSCTRFNWAEETNKSSAPSNELLHYLTISTISIPGLLNQLKTKFDMISKIWSWQHRQPFSNGFPRNLTAKLVTLNTELQNWATFLPEHNCPGFCWILLWWCNSVLLQLLNQTFDKKTSWGQSCCCIWWILNWIQLHVWIHKRDICILHLNSLCWRNKHTTFLSSH